MNGDNRVRGRKSGTKLSSNDNRKIFPLVNVNILLLHLLLTIIIIKYIHN